MDRIYKYQINEKDAVVSTRKFLKVDMQNGMVTVWYIDNPEENIDYELVVVGTGWETDLHGLLYIGTVQDGIYVWHVFARRISKVKERAWTVAEMMQDVLARG